MVRAKGIRTTNLGKDGHRAGDLLNRDFTADAPNKVWVSDFTYVRSWVGFVYTALIICVLAADRGLALRHHRGGHPLRCSQTRAATHMRAARNLRRFIYHG